MGHNISVPGAPEHVTCPRCKQQTPTYYDDYDIEEPICTRAPPNTYPNRLVCVHCEHDFVHVFTLTPVSPLTVAIIDPQGQVKYTRPFNHPDVQEALLTPGYSIRLAP